MIVQSVHIQNFRSVMDEVMSFADLTALVGSNGCGKSTFLRGLEVFYASSPRVGVDDFYNRDASKEIVIGVTFSGLSEEAKMLFENYMQGETLTVERVISWDEGKVSSQYHGASLQCPAFEAVRVGLQVKDRGKTAKEAYETLRSKTDYANLPAWSNLGAVEVNLKNWESANQNKCTRQRDDGQFFGFKEVGQGYLGRFTRFLFIPAVRDLADDASEGRGTVLTDLMDLVVRSVLANKEAVKQLRDTTQKQYQEILDPKNLTQLSQLSGEMTGTLKTLVPDASVELNWLPLEDITIPMPKADVKLVEDGFSSEVTRVGHGLQRAFIMTMLQHLTIAQTQIPDDEVLPAETTKSLPDLILAVEEPELYQHPNRQRHFSKILLQLSSGKTPGVAEKMQIIYCTHSPLFVGIDRISSLRMLKKVALDADRPKVTRVVQTTLDRVAEVLWQADGSPGDKYTGATLLPRLQAVMTPWMNEGFFADVAVLVEGEDDRAAILGMAGCLGIDFESVGISVIPCIGKTNLDKPGAILKELGVPIYILWDGDQGDGDANPQDNRRILRLVGETVTDWPQFVGNTSACFQVNLETTMRNEIGAADFDRLLGELKAAYGIRKSQHALKNPALIRLLLEKAQAIGKTSPTLQQIVRKIRELRK